MQFDDFLGVLALLKDTSSYEAKLKELVDREQAIKDAVESLKLGSSLKNAIEIADKKVANAKVVVEKAQVQADQLISDAGKVYASKFAKLQEEQLKADQAIADLNGYKSNYASKEDELNKAVKENAALQKVLQAQKDSVALLQIDLEARLEKLRQVMG